MSLFVPAGLRSGKQDARRCTGDFLIALIGPRRQLRREGQCDNPSDAEFLSIDSGSSASFSPYSVENSSVLNTYIENLSLVVSARYWNPPALDEYREILLHSLVKATALVP